MNHGRQVGVRIPQNQSTEQAPVMTVTQVSRVDLALVEYGDERGIKHTTLALISGDKAFVPPNADAWTAGFRPFAQAINEQVIEKFRALSPRERSVAVPTHDAVDVTGDPPAVTDAAIEAVENSLRNG